MLDSHDGATATLQIVIIVGQVIQVIALRYIAARWERHNGNGK